MSSTKEESSNENSTDVAPEAPTCIEYSAFSPKEKRWIVFIAAFAAVFSPLSSFIFYPAITTIADDLGVTVALVNLAITTYMIVSAVTPTILGNAADNVGRRPIYILALSIYLVANIGLGAQNSYPALLVLRMVQSAGSSGSICPYTARICFLIRCAHRYDIPRVWDHLRYCWSRGARFLRRII
jgi:hypothetical protein